MSDEDSITDRRTLMVRAVRQIVTRRERAPRSPRMERALKRLIWRYNRELRVSSSQELPNGRRRKCQSEACTGKRRKVEDD